MVLGQSYGRIIATFTSNSIELNGGAKFIGGTGGFLADAPSGTIIKTGSYYTGAALVLQQLLVRQHIIQTLTVQSELRNMTKASDV